jgi:hypothetical protein
LHCKSNEDDRAMANEVDSEKQNSGTKKKKSEEDQLHDILWNSLSSLQSDVQSLENAIALGEKDQRRFATLLNAKARARQQLFYAASLLRDPKLKLMTDTGRAKDFARLIKQSLLDENPAVKKMVEEANQRGASADTSSVVNAVPTSEVPADDSKELE